MLFPRAAKSFVVVSLMMLLSAFSFGGVPSGSPVQNAPSASSTHFAPGEVLVRFENGAFAHTQSLLDSLDRVLGSGTYTHEIFHSFSSMFIKSTTLSTDALISLLSQIQGVVAVDRNYRRHTDGATNDTYYPQLWAMENTGQDDGTVDADIDAKEAWDLQQGSHSVVVAVVDTGIDYNHPDLRANMWDGSDYGAPHHGWDFAGNSNGDNDNDPNPGDNDNLRHGTHVAGTIGAVGNNQRGVVGVSPNVSLMAVKVFRPNGYGYDNDILEGLQFIADKVDQGAHVVAANASYGGGGYSDTMKNAIATLGQKGVVFCAAAGNEGEDNDRNNNYPSNYDLDTIIAVAATDRNDQLASFSNYGATRVDLGAPGVDILSTLPGNKYASWNGTSMATPHVTGAVALLAANHPGTTAAQRIHTILSSVDQIDALSGKVATGGRLNVHEALLQDNGDNGGGDNGGGDNNNDLTTWSTGAYGNNEDRSETLHIAGATRLRVTVQGETESGYDFIYLYDENNQQIAKLDGKMNETYTVTGDSITARLTSDGSVTKSGVTVTIESVTDDGGNDDLTTWTTGAYDNNEDRSETLHIAGETRLRVTVQGETERGYDFIYLYDENNQRIAKLDGKIDKTYTVDGGSITARLTSDGSITKSGVTVTIESE